METTAKQAKQGQLIRQGPSLCGLLFAPGTTLYAWGHTRFVLIPAKGISNFFSDILRTILTQKSERVSGRNSEPQVPCCGISPRLCSLVSQPIPTRPIIQQSSWLKQKREDTHVHGLPSESNLQKGGNQKGGTAPRTCLPGTTSHSGVTPTL